MNATDTKYTYAVEINRSVRDCSAEYADNNRVSEWQSAMDLPDGTEFARGDDEVKPIKLYRVEQCQN